MKAAKRGTNRVVNAPEKLKLKVIPKGEVAEREIIGVPAPEVGVDA
jgi:hypothetical protein